MKLRYVVEFGVEHNPHAADLQIVIDSLRKELTAKAGELVDIDVEGSKVTSVEVTDWTNKDE